MKILLAETQKLIFKDINNETYSIHLHNDLNIFKFI